jgi:putative Mg2+ transporter-C (MgtC) family protein
MIQIQSALDQLMVLDYTPLVLAIVVGGMIGLEREFHGRPAGLRTHIMVCLSAALLIQASRSTGIASALPGANLVFDPTRLAAGIVTGVGFLGAAAVIRSGDIVRGITTGACVWAVAGLGIVIGQGQYALALVGGCVMLVVLIGFDYVFDWVEPVVYRRLTVVCRELDIETIRGAVERELRERGIKIQDLSASWGEDSGRFELIFHVRCRNRLQASQILGELHQLDSVTRVEWSHLSS